mgnify:CR=1 FL=1
MNTLAYGIGLDEETYDTMRNMMRYSMQKGREYEIRFGLPLTKFGG